MRSNGNAEGEKILQLSRKKAIRNISRLMLEELDRERLSKLIAAFLVLKANGHPDRDLVRYLVAKDPALILKLGLKGIITALPSFLSDTDLRQLVVETGKQMRVGRASKRRRQQARGHSQIVQTHSTSNDEQITITKLRTR